MNSAFNDKQAGKGAGQLPRHTLRAALACALVLGASGAALAQQHGERDDGAGYGGAYGNGQPQGERHNERFRLPQMGDPRQQEAQARGYDDPRRMQQYQQQGYPQQGAPQPSPDAQRRGGGRSMTADERAEMRRQINEAKDFYPQRR
ncbi:hypothetical protein [Massilia sp. 9096]|uniref:hypothetical protein n=1 Tax=Massilia sp. 9096 TaxID=1500894 RepID=UPI0005654743|nr:hypothetical protein [Massilia sp. 9096]